jgi:ATP-dependent protease HslVU (ClpYQ) peptidase subunit
MCTFRDKIYIVEHDYAFVELDSNFAVIGSGYNYAQPLLDYIVKNDFNKTAFKNVEDRKTHIKSKLKEVIQTVSMYSNYVGSDCNIIENEV